MKIYCVTPTRRHYDRWKKENEQILEEYEPVFVNGLESLLGRKIKKDDIVHYVNTGAFSKSVLSAIKLEFDIRRR